MKVEEKTKEQLISELAETRKQLMRFEKIENERKGINEVLRESEDRYKKMVNAITSYIYSVEVKDGMSVSTWHSIGCLPVTGYKPEDYESNPYLWHSMIHPEDRTIVEAVINEILQGKVLPPVEHRIIRRDGIEVWVRNTMVPYYNDKGELIKYDGLIENISDRKQAEEALRESEKKFRTIAQIAVDAIILSDSDGNIIFWNQSAERIFGYTEEEIIGKPLTILMPERYREDHQEGLERVKSKGKSEYVGKIIEMQGMRKNGNEFPVELSVATWKVREELFYLGVLRDITKRKTLEKELERLATTDLLTQTFNRTKFHEVMKVEMERAKRYNHPLSLLMFDIDHFKEVNDTYGHSVGDYVLLTLIKIVRGNLREIDILIRWGGEEFIIIAPDTDLKSATILAERIRKAVEAYMFDQVGKITVSFGVTQFIKDDTEDTIIKKADDAMYEAKRKGRNRVEVST